MKRTHVFGEIVALTVEIIPAENTQRTLAENRLTYTNTASVTLYSDVSFQIQS